MTYLGGYRSTELDRLNEYLSVSTENSVMIHDFGKLMDNIIKYESVLCFCVISFLALLAALFLLILIISWFEDRRIYYDYVFDWYNIRQREYLGIVGILEIEEDIEWLKRLEPLRKKREKELKKQKQKTPHESEFTESDYTYYDNTIDTYTDLLNSEGFFIYSEGPGYWEDVVNGHLFWNKKYKRIARHQREMQELEAEHSNALETAKKKADDAE